MKPLEKNTNEIACDLSRRLFIRNSSFAAMGLLLAPNLISCKKDETTEFSFYNVFDFSGIEDFIEQLESANNLDDLPADLQTIIEDYIDETGITTLDDENANSKLQETLNYLVNDYTISSLEMTKLKNGDSETFIDVMNRLTSIPTEISPYTNLNFLNQSIIDKYFSKYVTTTKSVEIDVENYDYLRLAEEMKQIRTDYTIKVFSVALVLFTNKSTFIDSQKLKSIRGILLGYLLDWLFGDDKKNGNTTTNNNCGTNNTNINTTINF